MCTFEVEKNPECVEYLVFSLHVFIVLHGYGRLKKYCQLVLCKWNTSCKDWIQNLHWKPSPEATTLLFRMHGRHGFQ